MANSIARLAVHFAADVTGLKAGIAQVNSQLATVGKGVSGAQFSAGGKGGSSSGLLGMLGMSTGTAGLLAGIGAAFGGVLVWSTKLAAEMQTLSLQFDILTGSAENAKVMMNNLTKLAADTPLGLQEVAGAAKTLLAMGESQSTIVAELEMLGNVATTTGQPLNELAQVFGQVMQAGRLTGNELRQFNERGIPLLKTLSEMMGVSTASIRTMVEAGEIGADKVVAAFRKMTSEGGLFANAMQRNLETLSGQWNKLWDRIKLVGAEAGKGPAELATFVLSKINSGLDSLQGPDAAARSAKNKQLLMDTLEQNKAADARKIEAEREAAKLRDEAEKAAKEMRKRADSIAQSLREPSEVFADTLAELKGLQEQGLLDWDTYVKGVTKAMGDLRAAEERSSPKLKAPQPSQGVGAVVQGTTAAFSAIQQAARDSQAQLDYQRQLIEIEKKEQATLDKILAAANAQKPVRVKQVNL